MKKIISLALCLMMLLTACTVTVNEPESSAAAGSSDGSRAADALQGEESAPSASASAPPPAVPAFLADYTAMEKALFDTLIPNMKENPATYIDAIYLGDALRIRQALESAASLWEGDAAGSGDERTKNYIGRNTIQDGKPVQLEHTVTARYEAEAGRFTVSITEEGQLLSRTQCAKTAYGYIAQHYIPEDKKRQIPSFRVLITLRDDGGMIGMEPNAKQPGELGGGEAYESPQTLRDWFVLEGRLIKVHSEEGANTEFEVSDVSPEAVAPSVDTSPADTEKYLLDLATSTLELLKNKDFDALGALVHPTKGLTFSPYGYVDTATAVRLGTDEVKALESDRTVYTWGVFDGSGAPMEYTFAEYYDRFIFSYDFTQAPEIAANRIIRTTLQDNLHVLGDGFQYVEFHVPGSEPNPDHSWASLRLVFGGHQGELYLVGIVHDEWTI